MPESTTINVAVHDTLPEVLDRLRGGADARVRLEIPAGSPLFLTANEFRALRTAVDRERLTLTIGSGDPLRRQLAAMFGLATAESPSDVPVTNGQVANAAAEPAERVQEAPRVQRTAAPGTPPALFPSEDDRRVMSATLDLQPAEHPQTRLPSAQTLLFGSLGTAALVGVLGFLAVYFFLPRATVALELEQQPLSDELVVGVAPSGAPALPGTDLTIPAQPVVTDVRVELSIPTTGEKLLPDKPAGGAVAFANATDAPVTIKKGTKITSFAGVEYAVTADVTVPAAANGTPSYATAQVLATQGGSAGNLEMGDLSGKLTDGVYFSNRNATLAGGTDRVVQVVSDEDIATLRQQVAQALPKQALNDFQAQLAGGEQVIAASLDSGEIAYTFDHQPAEEATSIAVTATARVTAVKYNAAAAIDQAEDALRSRLADAAPDGFELAPSTLVLDGPVLIDEGADGARFTISATASAAASFPSEVRDRLANDLEGKDQDEVAAILEALPGVQSFEVSYAPGFLGEHMPRVGGQIRIETDV